MNMVEREIVVALSEWAKNAPKQKIAEALRLRETPTADDYLTWFFGNIHVVDVGVRAAIWNYIEEDSPKLPALFSIGLCGGWDREKADSLL